MSKLIGVGKVVNGRMTYMGKNGGFSSRVRFTDSKKKEEPVVQEEKEAVEEVDLVFDFVGKNRARRRKVVEFPIKPTVKKEKKTAMLDKLINVGKKIKDQFIDPEEEVIIIHRERRDD